MVTVRVRGCGEHVGVRPASHMSLDRLVDVLFGELAAACWFYVDERDLCRACGLGAGQGFVPTAPA